MVDGLCVGARAVGYAGVHCEVVESAWVLLEHEVLCALVWLQVKPLITGHTVADIGWDQAPACIRKRHHLLRVAPLAPWEQSSAS